MSWPILVRKTCLHTLFRTQESFRIPSKVNPLSFVLEIIVPSSESTDSSQLMIESCMSFFRAHL